MGFDPCLGRGTGQVVFAVASTVCRAVTLPGGRLESLGWQLSYLHGMKESQRETNPAYVQSLWGRVRTGDLYPYCYAVVYDQHYAVWVCQVRKSKKLFSMYGAFGGRGCIIPDVAHVDERRVDICLVPLRAMHEMYGIPLPGGYEAYLKDAHPEFYVRGRNGRK